MVSVTPRPLFTPGKDPVPIVQEAGWAPGTVWTSAENLAHTGIRSPDRLARSQSLYGLRYPTHFKLEDRLLLYSLIDWSAHLQVTSLFTPTTPVATSKRDLPYDKDTFSMSSVTVVTRNYDKL